MASGDEARGRGSGGPRRIAASDEGGVPPREPGNVRRKSDTRKNDPRKNVAKPRSQPRTGRVKRKAGEASERLVESLLIRNGWFPLARNHHCPQGEVDLVMLDGEVVVFVEVRERRAGTLVDALSSITRAKQRKVVKAAMDYAIRAGLRDRALRFDVVAVTRASGQDPRIEHIRGAFDTSVLEEGHGR